MNVSYYPYAVDLRIELTADELLCLADFGELNYVTDASDLIVLRVEGAEHVNDLQYDSWHDEAPVHGAPGRGRLRPRGTAAARSRCGRA